MRADTKANKSRLHPTQREFRAIQWIVVSNETKDGSDGSSTLTLHGSVGGKAVGGMLRFHLHGMALTLINSN